jgi:hypothetical protein
LIPKHPRTRSFGNKARRSKTPGWLETHQTVVAAIITAFATVTAAVFGVLLKSSNEGKAAAQGNLAALQQDTR